MKNKPLVKLFTQILKYKPNSETSQAFFKGLDIVNGKDKTNILHLLTNSNKGG